MPEEYEVGTENAQEIIEEQRHQAHGHTAPGSASQGHVLERRPRWLDLLAMSTALFAVLAAICALKAGDKANEALFQANQAVLVQTQAVDRWGEFQADSIKKSQQTILATLLPKVGGSSAEVGAAQKEAKRRQVTQDKLKEEAIKLDQETIKINEESHTLLKEHQDFALGVTLFQIAIGLSAIAALLRIPLVWWVSLGAGGWAILVLIRGLLVQG